MHQLTQRKHVPRPSARLAGGRIQTKLKIGQPGDKYEQQADQMAERVMRMPEQEHVRMQPMEEEEEMIQSQPMEEEEEMMQMQPMEEEEEMLQPMCEDCQKEAMIQQQPMEEEEEELMPKANGNSSSAEAPSAVHDMINSTRGSGSSLDSGTLATMGNGFGTDFSQVNIHTDSRAVQMNRQLNAHAFTVGNDIYFNQGQFNPSSQSGKRLLAHELTHVIQQGGAIHPMIQKDGPAESAESSEGSSTPLADLVAGLLRDQLSNSSMRGHLSSLGDALQGLALDTTTEGGDQPAASAERLAALGIPRAFEITSAAILRDPAFARLRQRIIEIVGSSDEVALVAALAAGLAAVLADVPLSGSPSTELGAGFSTGGSFDLGSIQSLQFNNASLYLQYANEHFRTRLTGSLSRDAETEEFSGTGTGEVRVGSDTSHLMGRVTINSDGEVVLAGRLSSGFTFGGSDRLIFTTDLTHSFASGETIVTPGLSGRFSLGHDQSIRIGSSLAVSSDSGLTGVTGFLEYRREHLILRVEGSMTGLPEATGIMPGGDMRLQGTLTVPLW
jgi:hypothetical protein